MKIKFDAIEQGWNVINDQETFDLVYINPMRKPEKFPCLVYYSGNSYNPYGADLCILTFIYDFEVE